MSGIGIGLLLGLGLFCIWWSFWPQEKKESKPPKWALDLKDDLRSAGLANVSVRKAVGGCAGLGVFMTLLVFVATRALPIGLAFGIMVGYAPLLVVRARARQRRTALRDLWPDVVDNLASAVRAGLALPEAVAQLAVRGPVQLRPAFAAFGEDYRATGRFTFCLDRLKARLADPVADRLVESLRIARDVGGSDLGRLLRTLSGFLREDARSRAELEARQSWTVNAARLAIAAPWVVLALMCTRPDAVRAYSSVMGAMVLGFGAALSIVAYRLMSVLGRLPEDERVLR